MDWISDERALARAAVALGAMQVPRWSAAENRLARAAARHPPADLAAIRSKIRAGQDPLGEVFCRLRSPQRRRTSGQTFTPAAVVAGMVGWAARTLTPARVVDPGVGSGRFLVAAGLRWPQAELIGVDVDPLVALVARGTLAAAGLAGRARVLVADYRTLRLPRAHGPTLFLGNPPYVRHHHIDPRWKDWFRETARGQGLRASGLAGLHAHFFLATALHAAPGDAGALVTAAEWLDVNYGELVRSLFLGRLGGESVHVLDPAVPAFADACATSAIACFRPGTSARSVSLRRVRRLEGLGDLVSGAALPARVLAAASRWGPLLADGDAGGWPGGHGGWPGAHGGWPGGARRADGGPSAGHRRRAGYVELGEICRVHRGQVTGANNVWITRAGDPRVPGRFLFPVVSRAAELFAAGGALVSLAALRCVVDLPADSAELVDAEADLVESFLAWARAAGAADSYIARHREPWWRVGLREPAPILATYMARRPPAFVRNLAGARHVNIAHGLYPRQALPPAALEALTDFLRRSVSASAGRTYAGGLVKFEPREMERLAVPSPDLLAARALAGGSDPAVVPHA